MKASIITFNLLSFPHILFYTKRKIISQFALMDLLTTKHFPQSTVKCTQEKKVMKTLLVYCIFVIKLYGLWSIIVRL